MKIFLLSILLIFTIGNCFAQNPNWSVKASDYQYSMTFTTFLNVNGTTLSSTNDKVAAFVNNELRGVANVTYEATENKYVAYLTVYANTNNEKISFKIYDSVKDEVVNTAITTNFQIDGNVGSVFQSFSIANPVLNNVAEITDFSFKNIVEKSKTITADNIELLLPAATNVGNLIAEFSTSFGAKVFVNKREQISGTSVQDYTNPVTFQVISQDESVVKNYTIIVDVEVILTDLVVSLSANSPNSKSNPVEITANFNQPIVALNIDGFLLTNAAIQNISKVNNSQYKLNVVAIQEGNFTIELPANKVTATTNTMANTASNKLAMLFDSQKPYLLSIKRKTPVLAVTNANSLQFQVVFSEAVQNVVAANFKSVANANINVQKITDSQYAITVTNIENYNGAIALSLKETNTITDFVGNALRTSTLKSN